MRDAARMWEECGSDIFIDRNCDASSVPPALSEHTIPVVVMSSVKYVPYLAVFLENLINYVEEGYFYDVIIFHKNIEETDILNIKAISCNQKNISIRFCQPSAIAADEYYVSCPLYAAEAYYRLFAPWLLPQYSRAIIMDIDIVLQSGLSKLYETDLGECVAAGVKDILWQGMIADDFAGIRSYIKTDYPLMDPYHYINTGVVLLDLEKMRHLYTMEQVVLLSKTNKYRYQEQDLLNLLLEGKIKYIGPEWNYYVPTNQDVERLIALAPSDYYEAYQCCATRIKILHFAAHPKPWAAPEGKLSSAFWLNARRSMYYEVILSRLIDERISLALTCNNVSDRRSGARKLADKLLPPGTRRRKFAKLLLPKGSLRWRFCKQIYYIFRPKYRPAKAVEADDAEEMENDE